MLMWRCREIFILSRTCSGYDFWGTQFAHFKVHVLHLNFHFQSLSNCFLSFLHQCKDGQLTHFPGRYFASVWLCYITQSVDIDMGATVIICFCHHGSFPMFFLSASVSCLDDNKFRLGCEYLLPRSICCGKNLISIFVLDHRLVNHFGGFRTSDMCQ